MHVASTAAALDVIYYDCKRESTYYYSTIHTYYILHISFTYLNRPNSETNQASMYMQYILLQRGPAQNVSN